MVLKGISLLIEYVQLSFGKVTFSKTRFLFGRCSASRRVTPSQVSPPLIRYLHSTCCHVDKWILSVESEILSWRFEAVTLKGQPRWDGRSLRSLGCLPVLGYIREKKLMLVFTFFFEHQKESERVSVKRIWPSLNHGANAVQLEWAANENRLCQWTELILWDVTAPWLRALRWLSSQSFFLLSIEWFDCLLVWTQQRSKHNNAQIVPLFSNNNNNSRLA